MLLFAKETETSASICYLNKRLIRQTPSEREWRNKRAIITDSVRCWHPSQFRHQVTSITSNCCSYQSCENIFSPCNEALWAFQEGSLLVLPELYWLFHRLPAFALSDFITFVLPASCCGSAGIHRPNEHGPTGTRVLLCIFEIFPCELSNSGCWILTFSLA